MSIFEKKFLEASKVRAGLDLVGNAFPWMVGIGFALGGVYGLESYLGIDFAIHMRDNLRKAERLSDPQKDFYTLLGEKIIDEAEYNKIRAKKLGKVSDSNSILSQWKSIYDK